MNSLSRETIDLYNNYMSMSQLVSSAESIEALADLWVSYKERIWFSAGCYAYFCFPFSSLENLQTPETDLMKIYLLCATTEGEILLSENTFSLMTYLNLPEEAFRLYKSICGSRSDIYCYTQEDLFSVFGEIGVQTPLEVLENNIYSLDARKFEKAGLFTITLDYADTFYKDVRRRLLQLLTRLTSTIEQKVTSALAAEYPNIVDSWFGQLFNGYVPVRDRNNSKGTLLVAIEKNVLVCKQVGSPISYFNFTCNEGDVFVVPYDSVVYDVTSCRYHFTTNTVRLNLSSYQIGSK